MGPAGSLTFGKYGGFTGFESSMRDGEDKFISLLDG